MAYQNVGTPRFYVDQVNWQVAVGIDLDTSFDSIPNDTPIAGLKTPHITEISTNDVGDYATYNIGMIDENNNWCAILGHNLETANALFYLEYYDGNYVGINNDVALVNSNQYDGFQLWINGSGGDYFNPAREPSSHFRFVFKSKNSNYSWDKATFKIGSLCFGTYYDMPNAPNLSLTMSREYGGTKEFTTYNGSSMSNTMWSKPPKWGDLGAWELGSGNPALSRSGRRSWDLKFSYMADSDLWGSNQSLSTILNTPTGLDGTDCQIGGVEVTWTGDCVNHGSNNFEYATFDGVSKTGFHAEHTQADGISRAATNNTMNLTSGVIYKVTFNLSLTSGVCPKVDLQDAVNGGTIIEGGKQRAIEGGNELLFTVNETDTTGCIGFTHNTPDKDSEFTISDIYIQTGYTGFNYNLLTDDNFFSQVWHKTLGGTLPFIFQPDSSNNNPDQFCIAKFKDNSLKATQSAFNVYDISLSIEEVW